MQLPYVDLSKILCIVFMQFHTYQLDLPIQAVSLWYYNVTMSLLILLAFMFLDHLKEKKLPVNEGLPKRLP